MQTDRTLIISDLKKEISFHTKQTIIPNLIEKNYLETKDILTNVFGLPLYDLRIEMYDLIDMIDNIFSFKKNTKIYKLNNANITYEIKFKKNDTSYLLILRFFQYMYESEIEISILDD